MVVARDSAVRELKNKNPNQNEKERATALRRLPEADKVILGDKKQGSYGVVKKYKPDLIGLGYDQKWLEKDLKTHMGRGRIAKISLIKLKSHRPDKFKSSKLNHVK